MRVIETVTEFQAWRETVKNKTIGFVPTMGALHEGHFSLIRNCREENDLTILSIFVNPTQFNSQDDLKNYPKRLETDLSWASQLKVDVVFVPKSETELYPDQYTYRIIETAFSNEFCGKDRPGHFSGVLTVVMKLLNLISPDRAYFGEKDYQQLQLVKKMVKAFFMKTKIISCATVREKDGLALSSRNQRLTPKERRLAPLLFQTLNHSRNLNRAKEQLEEAGFQVDYLIETNKRRWIAARIGEVRLIDNVPR